MPNPSHDEQAAASTNLPAITPSTAALIHRAHTTLGLLRDVVQESSAEYWYERGKEATARQDWEEGLSAFRTCIAHDNNHWRATLQMVFVLVKKQSYEESALALHQAYYLPYLDRYVWADELSLDNWSELSVHFESCEETGNCSFNILLSLAIIYSVRGKNGLDWKLINTEVLTKLRKMYPQEVESSPTWYLLWARLCNFDEALTSFEYAVNIPPMKACVLYMAGLLKENWDLEDSLGGDSIDDYVRAIEIDPTHIYANFMAAQKYSHYSFDKQVAHFKSLIYYNRVINAAPDLLDAYLGRAYLCSSSSEVRDFNSAITDYKRAIELDPTNLRIHDLKAHAYLSNREYFEAIKTFDFIISSTPEDWMIYLYRGKAKEELKDYFGAIADFNKVAELAPSYRQIYKLRAKIKERLGDFVGAGADIQKFQQFYSH